MPTTPRPTAHAPVPRSTPKSTRRSTSPRDVHPMYGLARRHGKLPAARFVELARAFRAGKTDDSVAEQLLATYVPLISAMVARKCPAGQAQSERREGATGAAIAAFFDVLEDRSVALEPGVLHRAINMRVTRALEQEMLQAEHALTLSAQSAYRAAHVVRTAAAMSGEDVNWLTQDEVYAILGDSILVGSIHRIQNSRQALSLDTKPSDRSEEGVPPQSRPTSALTSAHLVQPATEATGSAATAAERLSRALATLPAQAAQLLVDAHGLFGRDAVGASEAAMARGVPVSAYRRALRGAESLLRSALEAQAREQAPASAPASSPDVSSGGRMPGLWCAADSARVRQTYSREAGAATARYAERVAAVIARFAQRERWSDAETQAAIRRLVAFRTGRSDTSEHPLTAQIAAHLTGRRTDACPAARQAEPPSAKPSDVRSSVQGSARSSVDWDFDSARTPSSSVDLEPAEARPADRQRARRRQVAISGCP